MQPKRDGKILFVTIFITLSRSILQGLGTKWKIFYGSLSIDARMNTRYLVFFDKGETRVLDADDSTRQTD